MKSPALFAPIVCLALAFPGAVAAAEGSLEPLAGAGSASPAPWHVVGLPNQTKPFTKFSVVDIDGRRAVKVEADSSYGNLVHPLAPLPAAGHLSWQWRVEVPLTDADLRRKSGDDTEIKVCVFFDEPMDKLPFADRQIIRLARSRSADPVPTATLCYVWDSHLAAGTALPSAFTGRLRYMVLQSGTDKLNRWLPERRNLAADFTRLFGDESDVVPPVIGVAIGADADNTQGRSIAYVSRLVLEP